MTIINSSTASGVLSSRGILRTLILLSLFIFAPISASAATYYIAPSGSNSEPGTQAQPFATLQKAHDIAVAGDTIFMRGGTYTPSAQTTLTRSGASSNHIKIWNYPGELPVVNGINLPAGATILRLSGNYWHVKGVEFKTGHTLGYIYPVITILLRRQIFTTTAA